jgi:Fe-S cluster biosynthesis and repair protein YggX
MNGKAFDNVPISEQVIKEAIAYVRDQTMLGNYEFLTLVNEEDNSFIQVALGETYDVEIRYPEKNIYVTKSMSYEETVLVFCEFYNGIMIDTQDYQDISYYLK